MFRVVICGGIGSGKSAVTRALRSFGAKVVVADEINAELLTDPNYIREIEHRFPSVVHNMVINKKELADLVYHDEKKRAELMSIAHPLIFAKMLSLYPNEKVVFYEIPLFSKAEIKFDRVWYVDAPVEVRVRRIMARDGVDESRARRIVELQKGEDSFSSSADLVLKNDGDLDRLRELVKQEYCYILDRFS